MSTKTTNPTIMLATGGTGGHIFPAVALAQALKNQGFSSAIIGGQDGMEQSIAARESLEFFGVRTGKLDRHHPDFRSVLRALAGFMDAFKIMGFQRPAVVVGFGGFASFPGAAAAVLHGIPLILHDSNARPGIVTKLLGRFARIIALAETAAQQELPKHKTVWVGMPVRELHLQKKNALQALGLDPTKRLVLVIGGSQGSMRLNALLPIILERTLTGMDVQVLHQTGKGRIQEVKPRVAHLSWYHCAEFVDGSTAWSASELGITRAGASTISDAAFHGVPLLMIPLPTSAEDHQRKNALAVQARGAGTMILESDLAAESMNDLEFQSMQIPNKIVLEDIRLQACLQSSIVSCLQPEHHRAMREAALKASPAGAAERLADLVLKSIHSSLQGSNIPKGQS